jgi:tetratricopeptide (TPR) repeat protein
MKPVTKSRTPDVYRDGIAAAVLAVVTFVVFAPALDCEFLNYDDNGYVTANPHVRKGLTADGVRWAFTTFAESNWHPLTWLSLQLDASLWRKPDGGLDPSGFHQTSVLLHSANAALVFLALRSLTGCFWRSAAVALLFAVHPLRLESVAWVAERKDVLSVFFGLLTLWAYAGYGRQPVVWRYLAVAGLFLLSLLSKPMLVTLPFLLLVLDWWPLRRWPGRSARVLLLEKLPLFGLVAASSWITFTAQREGGAVKTLERYPVAVRLENAAVSYAEYLGQTVWPVGMAVHYSHPVAGLPPALAAGSAVLLAALTAGAVALRRRAPYLLAGWLWFLGTLVPVIGLVQVSDQARADRYTYFPQIGVLLAACWAAADLARARPRVALAAGAVAAGALAITTRSQLPAWHDSVALWEHSRKVTGPNFVALTELGQSYAERGQSREAAECYRDLLRLYPDSVRAHLDLGSQLARLHEFDQAADEFRAAIALRVDDAPAHTYLGNVLASRGKLKEAKQEHETALRLDPGSGEAYCNLGSVELRLQDPAAAEGCFRRAVQLNPQLAAGWCGLGDALIQLGRFDESVPPLREALRLNPQFEPASALLGRVLKVRLEAESRRTRPGATPGTAP